MLGLSVPFDFTSVIYNAEEDSFRFEWNSKPNRTYALYFSETLEELMRTLMTLLSQVVKLLSILR